MRNLALAALLLAACASGPRGEAPDHERAVYESVTVERVRGAALQAVTDVAWLSDGARVAEDGRVLAEGGASGEWSYEVRFVELDSAVAAEVDVHTTSCRTRIPIRTRMASVSRPGRGQPGAVPIALEDGHVEYVSRAVATARSVRERTEAFERSGPNCSTGSRERTQRRILDGIRAALESEEPTPDQPDLLPG